jgi:hypothetical protein
MELLYVNGLGPNYKGDNIYEFIFGNKNDVWGEGWESKPCNGNPSPPSIDNIKKVGVLKQSEVELTLIQDSDFFSMEDAMDNVIALAWETETNDSDFTRKKRLVFQFGEAEQSVKDKLYEQDIVLEFEKKVVYEK